MWKKSTQDGPCCGVIDTLVLTNTSFASFKVPAESPKCSVEEFMEEKGSACGACLQQVGRTFVLPQYS